MNRIATLALTGIAVTSWMVFVDGQPASEPAITNASQLKPATADGPTYKLVHAIGNTERVSAVNLAKGECETRRDELKLVSSTLGAGGSVTCLPSALWGD